MNLDDRIPNDTVRKISGQFDDIPEEVQQELLKLLKTNETDEFYIGLASGLLTAITLLQRFPKDGPLYTSGACSVVCRLLEKKEIMG